MDKIISTGFKGNCRIKNDGSYIVKPKYTDNEFISMKNSQSTSDVSVQKYDGNSNLFLIFKYNKQNSSYSIMFLQSYLFLSVKKRNDSNYLESKVLMHEKGDDYLIEWIIVPDVDDNFFYFEMKETHLILEYDPNKKNFILRKKRRSELQLFEIKYQSHVKNGIYSIIPKSNYKKKEKNLYLIKFDENDGCFYIINLETGLSLSTRIDSTIFIESTFYNLDNQKWIIVKINKKEFFFVSKLNLLRLEYDKDNTNPQMKFKLKPFNSNSSESINQMFYLNENKPNIKLLKNVNIEEINKRIKYRYSNEIILNNSITKIDNDLLQNNEMLIYLEIPISVNQISENAFINCNNIKAIKCDPKWLHLLPNPINVENIFVPDGIEKIENDPFIYFPNLKSLELPQSLKTENCDQNLFSNIYNIRVFKGDPIFLKKNQKSLLNKVIIPSYVKLIPEECFISCTYLKKIIIENNSQLEKIEDRAFANCKNLETFDIPQSCKNIAPDAFYGCNKDFKPKLTEDQNLSMVESLVIDSNVTIINEDYKKCRNIKSLEIPLNVTQCQPGILKSFIKLKMVKCDPKWLNYFISKNIEMVFIPEGITDLKKEHFDYLVNLKLIQIPESVINLEKDVFINCKEINSVKCGINHFPYLNQSQIKTLVLNSNVNNIYRSYFEGFINLENCILPETIYHISPDIFYNCKKLMNVNHKIASKYINNSVTIENNRTEIIKEEFENWSNLEYLSIPETVNSIEEGTFDDCIYLKRLKCDPKWFHLIPKNFIKSILIPDFVKKIQKEQFEGFYALSCIELPDEIEINDSTIFDSCESLVTIKCKNSLFESLSDKTKKRCFKTKIKEYTKPIYNFQTDPNKFHDETSFISGSLKIPNDSKKKENIEKNDELPKTTDINDLIEFNPDFERYKQYIEKVIQYSQTGEIKIYYTPINSSLSEISKICGAICFCINEFFQIRPRIVQILTILRFADNILNDEDSHGAIGEIKTGEGKSLIITILSIVLIFFGRNVDIVTSNVELAKRDQREQLMFFELFSIPTSLFIHKENDIEFISSGLSTLLGNDEANKFNYNINAFKCRVIYSTNSNLEHFYIYSIFDPNPISKNFDVVLIDEIDNMFIDESGHPALISRPINYAYFKDIFQIVFLLRDLKTSEIVKILKYYLPNASEYNEEKVEILKNAAQIAVQHEKNIDYIIENGQILIIDHNTGFKKRGSRWSNFVHEMVEIKEGIEPRSPSVLFGQITHHNYFNLYRKIAGLTGTIGTKNDEKLLKEGYNVEIFKIPRHFKSQNHIYLKKRPDSLSKIFTSVKREIEKETEKGRPVLVIWNTLDNAEKFMKEIDFPLAQSIFGINPRIDNYSIRIAGKSGALTIATLAAGRGVDIKLEQKSIDAGGLHVIIPLNMMNQRSLEQASGRAGRQGQPGSVSIYISENDKYIEEPKFKKKYENLFKLEIEFSLYLKNNFCWMFEGPQKYTFKNEPLFPYAADYSIVLEILVRCISILINQNLINFYFNYDFALELFKDFCYQTVMMTWGAFFSDLSHDDLNVDNFEYCITKYERFLKKINKWFDPIKSKTVNGAIWHIRKKLINEMDLELVIICGIEITSFVFSVVFPKAAPTIRLLSGAFLDGGLEIYHKLHNNEQINWAQVLICSCGGLLKGAIQNKIIYKHPLVQVLITIGADIAINRTEDFMNGFIGELMKDENEEEIVKLPVLPQYFKGLCLETGKWLAKMLKDEMNTKDKKNKIKTISSFVPKIKAPQLQIDFIKMTMKMANEAYSGKFSVGKVIQSNEINEMYKPKFYCLEHSNDLYVVIRGSDSNDDWLTDFDCSEIHQIINGKDIYFHYGFYTAANYIIDNINVFLTNNYDNIYFVGHSYAAGVSSVLCMLTKNLNELKNKKIYAMAFAPPPSMSRCPADIAECIFAFINRHDFVPHACLYNIANTMKIYHFPLKIVCKILIKCLNLYDNRFKRKLADTLEKQIFNNLPDDLEELHVRKVKGIVFGIGLINSSRLCDCRINELDLPNMIALIPGCAMDHKMSNYIKVFEVFDF